MQIKCTYFFEKVKTKIWSYLSEIVDYFETIEFTVLFH